MKLASERSLLGRPIVALWFGAIIVAAFYIVLCEFYVSSAPITTNATGESANIRYPLAHRVN